LYIYCSRLRWHNIKRLKNHLKALLQMTLKLGTKG
jgi:phosphoribosyl-dephospho-CoA transferase